MLKEFKYLSISKFDKLTIKYETKNLRAHVLQAYKTRRKHGIQYIISNNICGLNFDEFNFL